MSFHHTFSLLFPFPMPSLFSLLLCLSLEHCNLDACDRNSSHLSAPTGIHTALFSDRTLLIEGHLACNLIAVLLSSFHYILILPPLRVCFTTAAPNSLSCLISSCLVITHPSYSVLNFYTNFSCFISH